MCAKSGISAGGPISPCVYSGERCLAGFAAAPVCNPTLLVYRCNRHRPVRTWFVGRSSRNQAGIAISCRKSVACNRLLAAIGFLPYARYHVLAGPSCNCVYQSFCSFCVARPRTGLCPHVCAFTRGRQNGPIVFTGVRHVPHVHLTGRLPDRTSISRICRYC